LFHQKNTMKILAAILLFTTSIYGQQNQLKIRNIKAYLFYNQDKIEKVGGTWSENVIDNNDVVLFNAIIGEGTLKGPARNTLLVVEVVDTVDVAGGANVRVTVYDKKNKLVFSQEQSASLNGRSNVYHAPFLLYDTGCEILKIKAELLDREKKPYSSLEKSVDYHCGE